MRKITLILTFLFISTASFAQVQDLQKVRIDSWSGGMVSNATSNTLQLNQAASMVNVRLDRKGLLVKRRGQALFNLDVSNTAFVGLGRFDPDRTTSYLIAASGVDVIRSESSSSNWTRANPDNPLTSGQNTEFVQANDLLFTLNGFDGTAWYNGSLWTDAGSYPSSPPTARTGAWLRNYLFLAGATTETDWIYFSNNLEPTVFDASDILKVNTGDGQAIQRVLPFRLNELIVYKERSVFVLDITGSTPLTDWTLQPISTTVGAIAQRAVVSLGNDQWFLSSEPVAVRSLVRTTFDKILVEKISEPIQDIFDRTGALQLNITHVNKAAAILFDDKYILAIPTGTSTVNNTVLVYSFFNKAWYIITGWFPSDWVEFDNRLFYTDANDGRVIEVFTGTTGDFEKGPNFIDSASVPSVGIDFTWISPSLDFDSPENFKQIDSIEIQAQPTGNYNANVFYNCDNKGFNKIGGVNLSGGGLQLPFTLPGQLTNNGISRKTFQLSNIGECKEFQVMVQNQASSETVGLERVTVFGRVKPWRRQ